MNDFGGTMKYRYVPVPENNQNTENTRYFNGNAHVLEIFRSFDNN